MAQQLIGIGASANTGLGDKPRSVGTKINEMFAETYASKTKYNNLNSRLWVPKSSNVISSAPSAPGANSIRLSPGYIDEKITISTLVARVATLFSGGLFQLAIYAANSASYPTGNALISTASISTTSTGLQTSAASKQLDPALYWWALNCDNATAIFNSYGPSGLMMGQTIGVQGAANVFAAATGLAIAQTFGTWPDLTATSWASSHETTGANIPAIGFQIASVP